MLIENCDIDSGDDAICLKSSLNPCRNIVVRNCKVSSNTAPLKFGTSSRGGFIDVSVTNCYFYNSPMGAIKLQLVDGGRLENVDISRIVMEDVGNPIFIRLGNRGRSYGEAGTRPTCRHVEEHTHPRCGRGSDDRGPGRGGSGGVQESEVETSPEVTDREKSKSGPIMITGIPGHYVENVVLENITISYPGGGNGEGRSARRSRRYRSVSRAVLLRRPSGVGRLYPPCPQCGVQKRGSQDPIFGREKEDRPGRRRRVFRKQS